MYQLQSLERAIELLGALSAQPRARLQDLCERTGANQTTVLRTLRVLERHGLVRRSVDGSSYSLGTRLTELGHAAVAAIDVPGEIRPAAALLAQQYSATVHVGLYRGEGVTVIDKLDSQASVVRYSSLGTRLPLHASAAGKAVIALLAPEDPAELGVRPPLAAHTRHSITDLAELRADIAVSRQRRYTIEREEFQLGFGCVGSAFRMGDEVYAVSISGQLVDDVQLAERGERLRGMLDEFLAARRGAAQGMPA